MNKHRANIRRKLLFQSVSIDHIDFFTYNGFAVLKRRELYWMYKLKTIQPLGLKEATEVII